MKTIIFYLIFIILCCNQLLFANEEFDYASASRMELLNRCLYYANLYKDELTAHNETRDNFANILAECQQLKIYVNSILENNNRLSLQNIEFRERITYLENYRYDPFDFSLDFSFGCGTGGLINIQSALHFGYGIFGFAGVTGIYDYTFFNKSAFIIAGGIGYSL